MLHLGERDDLQHERPHSAARRNGPTSTPNTTSSAPMITGIAAVLNDSTPFTASPARVASTTRTTARPTTRVKPGRTSEASSSRIVRRGENQMVRQGRAATGTVS